MTIHHLLCMKRPCSSTRSSPPPFFFSFSIKKRKKKKKRTFPAVTEGGTLSFDILSLFLSVNFFVFFFSCLPLKLPESHHPRRRETSSQMSRQWNRVYNWNDLSQFRTAWCIKVNSYSIASGSRAHVHVTVLWTTVYFVSIAHLNSIKACHHFIFR